MKLETLREARKMISDLYEQRQKTNRLPVEIKDLFRDLFQAFDQRIITATQEEAKPKVDRRKDPAVIAARKAKTAARKLKTKEKINAEASNRTSTEN